MQKSIVIKFVFAVSLFFLFCFKFTSVVKATDYYVATNGNDSNSGTINSPFLTLNSAVTHLTPGDTLYIRAGTYTESLEDVIPSGTSWSAPVTITAYSSETVTLIPDAGANRVIYLSGDTATIAKYIIIDGLILDGQNVTYDTVKITTGANNIKIRNSEIKNAPSQGVLITQAVDGTDYVTLTNDSIHNNGITAGLTHGVYSQVPDTIIEDCTIYDNKSHGIHLYSGDTSNSIVRNNVVYNNIIGVYSGDSVQVYNNVVYDAGNQGIRVEYGPTNATVYNNTLYNSGITIGQTTGTIVANNITVSGTTGITVTSDSDGTTFQNNLSASNSSANYSDSGVSTVSTNNLFADSYDPKFTDSSTYDFHLESGSDAINTGATLSSVTDDIDGVSRPQSTAYDIGAYEYPDPSHASPWIQTDWVDGSGQLTWFEISKYYSNSSNITASTANQITLPVNSSWCSNSFCDTSWSYRKKITFDNTDSNIGTTSATLTNFPVLIKLSSSNLDYSEVQSAGEDLRFVDSSGNDLAYQIEKFDSSGTSIVWVKVPEIAANSSTSYIYVYYGNSSATDHQQANSVWDSDFQGVWHLDETGDGTTDEYVDSTGNGNDGTGGFGTSTKVPTVDSSAQLGNGQTFDGSDDFIRATDNTLDFGSGDFTFSIWLKASGVAAPFFLSSLNPVIPGYSFRNNNTYVTMVVGDNAANQINRNQYDPNAWNNTWHYFVFKYENKILSYFRDGARVIFATNSLVGDIDNGRDLMISCEISYSGSTNCFNGSMDELRMSSVARSDGWEAATYHNQTDDFTTFDSEEQYITPPIISTLTSSVFDTQQSSDWGNVTISATTPTNTIVQIKVRTANDQNMDLATAFASCNSLNSGENINLSQCVNKGDRYVQYQLVLTSTDGTSTPTVTQVSIPFSKYVAPVSLPICKNKSPSYEPVIWVSEAGSNFLTVQIRDHESDSVDGHFLLYGTSSEEYDFGSGDIGADTTSYKIKYLNPNTTYYLKIRSANGCASSVWSREIVATTSGPSKNISLEKNISTPALEKEGDVGQSEGYTLKITVRDENGKPVEGASVTIHSVVQTAVTNEDGIAEFSQVEAGEHTVTIAYKDFEGTEKLTLDSDMGVKNIDLSVAIKKDIKTLTYTLEVVSTVLAILVIYLLVKLSKVYKKH